MLNTVKINARNLQLVKELVKLNDGNTVFTRTQLRAFHKKLRGRTGAPYFICKNTQARPNARDAKSLGKNVFTVDRFLSYAAKHPPAPMPERKAKAKKEQKPKREAVGKKGAATVKAGAKPKVRAAA
jgi:hypothetical protein